MTSTISHGSIIFGGKSVLISKDLYHENDHEIWSSYSEKYAQYSRQVFINSHSPRRKDDMNKNCCVLLPFKIRKNILAEKNTVLLLLLWRPFSLMGEIY